MRWVWVLGVIAVSLLTGACKEGTVSVHRLTFEGVHAVSESALRNALSTRQSSWIPWGPKRYFDRTRFDADLARLRAFYTDRGFPNARVTGFDIKLNDKQDRVDIVVSIDEGEPIRIESITFAGFESVPAAHFEQMQKNVPLRVGQPRDRQQVVATHEMALNELRDHGYPYAKVGINETPRDRPTSVDLVFAAEPGAPARFGAVDVTGERSVGEDVVRRELAFKPGDPYRRSLVQETQRRLYDKQLFRFVNVEPVPPVAEAETQPSEVPTRVTVAEGPHYHAKFGAGYGTEEKVRVEADYHHLNALGAARTAGVRARWSSLDRGVRADVTQPYVLRPNFSLSGEGQQWYTFTPAYRATTSGGKATLIHRTSARTFWSASFTSEHDSSAIARDVLSDPKLRNDLIALGLDPVTGEQNGTLTAFGFDVHHSTADNALNAHRGYQLTLHGEAVGGFLPGTFNYQAVSADLRHYVPIGERLVFANRVQAGNLNPKDGTPGNVPFSKKYFLGGATSIRGWGVYEVSPLSGSGLPLGGNSMLGFSTEVRAAVRGNLGAVVFLDGGNVWAKSWDARLNDLRYAVGSGLRYQTPIGPARFDVGYQINPIPDLLVKGEPQSRRWRMHFSIGESF